MPKLKKKYKVITNSKENLEELLQEMYDECCRNVNETQNEISKLINSCNLKEEFMDGKAKYAKALNDFFTNKNKALNLKLDIAKILSDILKNNGDAEKAIEENNSVGNWSEFMNKMDEIENKDEPNKYTINK